MKYKALFLDFYGTLVYEDDDIISEAVKKISLASTPHAEPKDIASFWWGTFHRLFTTSFLDSFQTQRRLESVSLNAVLKHFHCAIPTSDLDTTLFAYWVRPELFADTNEFLAENSLPLCIISNIDRKDIQAGMHCHGLLFSMVMTSEDAQAYKPPKEIFLRLKFYTLAILCHLMLPARTAAG